MNIGRRGAAGLCVLLVLWSGCDTGLQPLHEPSGFTGLLRFKNWPSPDSVHDLRIVAFVNFPSDSSGIIPALLQGKAIVYPPVGTTGLLKFTNFQFVDSLEYSFTTENSTLQVSNYEYIVVALQYGSNILTDWAPAGVYTTQPSTFTPTPLRVLLHRTIPGIDITVDFNNPPPKPWR
jgi:hypothetical protein